MSHDPLGPKNLNEAFGFIHKEMTKRNGQRNGQAKSSASPEPNKICTVCTKLFYHKAILVDPELKPMPCPECDAELAQGKIAVICPMDKRYAFISSKDLAGHGPIMEVSSAVMDAVEKRANEQSKQADG